MIKDLKLIVYDFDGVLTDNTFYLSEKGLETVRLSRADGLAISLIKNLGIKQIILSSEKNPVVKFRANKLGIDVYFGVGNKKIVLKEITKKLNIDFTKTLYLGNDINDLEAMSLCSHRACPQDSYQEIKNISNIIIPKNGGTGVVRYIYDKLIKNNY